MELAALRTRKAKRPRKQVELFKAWKEEARALGFDLQKARAQVAKDPTPQLGKQALTSTRSKTKSASALSVSVRHLIRQAAAAALRTDRMSGVRVNLRQASQKREREAER